MSDFYGYSRNPKTGRWENAHWIDNYYCHYVYGVQFPSDLSIFPVEEVRWRINEEEANILNSALEKEPLECPTM